MGCICFILTGMGEQASLRYQSVPSSWAGRTDYFMLAGARCGASLRVEDKQRPRLSSPWSSLSLSPAPTGADLEPLR